MANLYSSAANNCPRNRSSIGSRSMILTRRSLVLVFFRQILLFSLFRRIQRSPRTRVSSRMLMHADNRTRRESCCPEKTRTFHRQAGRRRRSVIDFAVANRFTEKPKDTHSKHFLLPVAHHVHVREIDGFLDTLLKRRGSSSPRAAETGGICLLARVKEFDAGI